MGSNPATMTTIALAPFTGGASLLATPMVYQGEEARKARREAQAQADQQRRQFEQAQSTLATRQQEAESTAAADAARRSARRRQLSTGTGGLGRQGTILSGGLGGVGSAPSEGKTILGA